MALNIVNVANIEGKLSAQSVATAPSTAIVPEVTANQLAKVNALYVSNIHGTNAATIDVYVSPDGGTTKYYIASTITVPADSTLDVLSKHIYLEPTWSMWVKADTTATLEALASWEAMS